MSYSIEDVRRLVPEATEITLRDGMINIMLSGQWESVHSLRLLLSTRRKLEIATESLEKIANASRPGNRISIAAEALSAIKEE